MIRVLDSHEAVKRALLVPQGPALSLVHREHPEFAE